MGYLNSARQQVKSDGGTSVIPDAAQTPAAHTDFLGLANALESKLVMRLPSISNVSSLGTLQAGMVVAETSSPWGVYVYTGTAWRKISPTIYSGTTAPSAGTGADGDVYVMV